MTKLIRATSLEIVLLKKLPSYVNFKSRAVSWTLHSYLLFLAATFYVLLILTFEFFCLFGWLFVNPLYAAGHISSLMAFAVYCRDSRACVPHGDRFGEVCDKRTATQEVQQSTSAAQIYCGYHSPLSIFVSGSSTPSATLLHCMIYRRDVSMQPSGARGLNCHFALDRH